MIQKEGPGWRLAKDPLRKYFPVLIGGEDWAIELTEVEAKSLVELIQELTAQHQQLEDQLMPQEALCLEMERQQWWGCLDGDRESWSLRLILHGDGECDRGAEMHWPIPAAQQVTYAMRMMWECPIN